MSTPTLRARASTLAAAATGPGACDLGIYQGDDYLLEVTFTDTAGAAVDPALYDWKAQIRAVSADADAGGAPLGEFTPTIAGMVLELRLDSATSTAIGGGTYRWDLQGIRVSDDWVTTFLAGPVVVTSEITR